MIFSGLIGLITTILGGAIGFFPTADSSVIDFITSKVGLINDNLAYINHYFPSGDLVRMISLILSIELIMIIIKISAWILSTVTGGLFKNNV